MDRRVVLGGLVGAGMLSLSTQANAQQSSLDTLLEQLEEDSTLVEGPWTRRERQATRSVGVGSPSERRISQRAIDMIVRLEVGSQRRYERLYTRPIWPRGQSGVTIGIGYDLRFANETYLQRDWGELLPAEMLETLKPVLGLSRIRARDALPSVQSVVVPWSAAHSQFLAFVPYPTKETEDAFPNCADLSDDSFGALVSLIYNRGADMPMNSQRRREMREIRDLMRERDFAPIPNKFREMKRLWENDPDAAGLVLRREVEAVLFEEGLTQSAK